MNARRSRPKFPCFDHLTSPPIDSACCLPCESAATLSRGRLPAALWLSDLAAHGRERVGVCLSVFSERPEPQRLDKGGRLLSDLIREPR